MVPILYDGAETGFTSGGLGALADTISCTVTEERSSTYELELEYPITGLHYADLQTGRIILAKANAADQTQPFRVYSISRPIGGTVTVHAQHISYDMAGLPVKPYTAAGVSDALQKLKTNCTTTCNFSFSTDLTDTTTVYTQDSMDYMRSRLAGSSGSIRDLYGGEYRFDRYDVQLLSERGKDSGLVIAYGQTLTDLQQDESIADMYTGCVAYYRSTGGTLTLSDTQYCSNHDRFPAEKVYILDVSGEYTSAPTVSDLNARAAKYVTDAQLGKPTVSIDVSYADLARSVEYAGIPQPTIGLCDTVTVRYPALGVDSKAKVIKTTYDTLAESYIGLSLGDARPTVYSTIRDMTESWAHDLSQQISQQAIATQQHMDAVADLITSSTGIPESNTFMQYLSTPVGVMPVRKGHATYTFTPKDMTEIGITTIKNTQFQGKFNFTDSYNPHIGFNFSAGGISADANIAGAFEDDWLTDMTLTGLDTRNTTNMSSLFSGAWLFGFFDASGLDTRRVTNMSYMFFLTGVSLYDNTTRIIDLSSWDVKNVKNFTCMFAGSDMSCMILNLTGWGKQISSSATLTSMLGWEGEESHTAEEILLLDDAADFNTRLLTETGLADNADTIRHARIIVKDEAYAAITAMPALSAFASAGRIIKYSDSFAKRRGLPKSSS